MNAKQLIEELKKLPENTEIIFENCAVVGKCYYSGYQIIDKKKIDFAVLTI